MQCLEYYLTAASKKIFEHQTADIATSDLQPAADFDLVELGPGDVGKIGLSLGELQAGGVDYNLFFQSISREHHPNLERRCPQIPGLPWRAYRATHRHVERSQTAFASARSCCSWRPVFGNVPPEEALGFCKAAAEALSPGDCYGGID